MMKKTILAAGALCAVLIAPLSAVAETPLGLPPVPVPEDNPVTEEKVLLGIKLFNDKRFSSTGEVNCATCHDGGKAFTDSPLSVSEGINGLTGTRNAPTVINAAYMHTQFWDGREPDLEEQSKGPFVNPVEMGLESHDPILEIVRSDKEYGKMFKKAFGISQKKISMDHVKKAIASFERTVIAGDSPFDRYMYGGDKTAMSEAAIRGMRVFRFEGRCVSCHTTSQTFALFTDNKFHNLNVNFELISDSLDSVTKTFIQDKEGGADLDVTVLTNQEASELGRFVVSTAPADIGAFKTPTLRNIELTAPYMHDGSLKTLEEVVDFYNNGGRVEADGPVNDFQSGGIRPLNLTDQQKADLVEFLKALTSSRESLEKLAELTK
ncbi:cytochrome-c peroxidase [Emcibacter sp.]|uniref:cytochrome-c peroxidase n=1 Tax=Emcibacter sp. TaxID=1979954 RepID=UPI002AA8DBF8|nr:cytochrome c peroxidase [Emcibacter sp.]